VVLAAHAQQGHMRWTRTSVSQPIARAAAAATLFLPYGGEGFISQADGSSTLRNILLPVDSAPRPEPAIEAAWRLAWALHCPEVTFTLLHVGRAEIPSVEAEEQPGWTWKKLTRDGDVVDAIVAVAGADPLPSACCAAESHRSSLFRPRADVRTNRASAPARGCPRRPCSPRCRGLDGPDGGQPFPSPYAHNGDRAQGQRLR
jgi:hypothetical protein